MTIVAIRLLDRTGRRPLLLGGTTGMAAGMIVVALTFAIGGSQLHGGAAYIAIAGLLLYTGSFAIGLGPVFWLLISEIYPVRIRGRAMSVLYEHLREHQTISVSLHRLLQRPDHPPPCACTPWPASGALLLHGRLQTLGANNASRHSIENECILPRAAGGDACGGCPRRRSWLGFSQPRRRRECTRCDG
jgi:sugar transport protein